MPRKKYYKYILKTKIKMFRRFRKKFLKKRWGKFRIKVKSNVSFGNINGGLKKMNKFLFFLKKRMQFGKFLFHSLFEPYIAPHRRKRFIKNSIFYKKELLFFNLNRLYKYMFLRKGFRNS